MWASSVFIRSLRGFLLNLCLKLAGLFLSLARKLCGQSVLPATREVFAAPAVALLLFAVISLLSSQSHAGDIRPAGDLVVGSRSSDRAVLGFNGDATDS